MLAYKKNRIIFPLFLLYFVLYAISPFSQIGPVNSATGHTYFAQRKPVSLQNVEIFFLDVFFLNFTGRDDADDSTFHLVLFKKIRAVIQSVTDVKYKLAKISGNVENQPVFKDGSFVIREVRESAPKPYESFLAFFSGLSPPSA